MKYFIYWCFYASSLGGGPISGTVEVTDTTINSYIYGEEYFTWNIVDKKNEVRDYKVNSIKTGEYVLEANGVKSVMVINNKYIIHYISTDPPVNIQMTRKHILIDE